MPTEYLHRLEVVGSPDRLAAFRADTARWKIEPWATVFGLESLDRDPSTARLVYRYNDDYKRPSPSIPDIASKYRELTFIHEACDECGDVAARTLYRDGVEALSQPVDAESLDWVEWSDHD